MGRRHAQVFLDLLRGDGFAQPNPRPMFSNPPGLLSVEPHSKGLRERIWWGAGSNATAVWAAKLGVNLQSSTLKDDETGELFHVQQAAQIRAFRAAWKDMGHAREPGFAHERRRPGAKTITLPPLSVVGRRRGLAALAPLSWDREREVARRRRARR
jgi:alkanesulfonate monooxygenase SsuD/methylene tetrahydromethanopterin reductase-like flavin-dependent oxidoreductase (luciferase family)